MAAGADANARDSRGVTPLHIAVMNGAVYCTMALIEARADLEAKCGRGRTAIEYGMRCKDVRSIVCAVLLAGAGAEIPVPGTYPLESEVRVADAARARLAALQPEAVEAALVIGAPAAITEEMREKIEAHVAGLWDHSCEAMRNEHRDTYIHNLMPKKELPLEVVDYLRAMTAVVGDAGEHRYVEAAGAAIHALEAARARQQVLVDTRLGPVA